MITQSNAVEVQFDNFNILDNKLKAKIISIEQINDEKFKIRNLQNNVQSWFTSRWF